MMEGASLDPYDNVRLMYSPTWAIALSAFIFILVSIIVEKLISYVGQILKTSKRKYLEEAFEKMKDELMMVGFISIALSVGQKPFSKICVPSKWTKVMHQCRNKRLFKKLEEMDYEYHVCQEGKSRFITMTSLHQLHILIFTLVIVHICVSAIIMGLGRWKVHIWKIWEERALEKEQISSSLNHPYGPRLVRETTFVQRRLRSKMWTKYSFCTYVHSFVLMIFNPICETDYHTLRHGFIQKHVSNNMKFDFHKYMIRTLEDDFKHVVGIGSALWGYTILFLLLNVDGWEVNVWIESVIPIFLTLTIGTKLQHIITKMAIQISNNNVEVQGMPNVILSDELFWFKHPRLLLHCIHFILFQNAISISTQIWGISTFEHDQYACLYNSRIVAAINLNLGIISLAICGYNILPIYALVSQMGNNLKGTIFVEHIQEGVMKWHRQARSVIETRSSHVNEIQT